MGSHYEAPIRRPLVAGEKSYHDVTVDIAKPIETKANKQWWIVFTISLMMFLWGLGWIIYTCLLYTSPSPRDLSTSRMPSSA